MKILAIRGCNLASLAGEFEIDLARAPFAEAGVFAIVGNTGAGKSTLLDALCVALFDRTPRLTNHSRVVVGRGEGDPCALGAQDARTLLRRGAAAGWAEVDFESRDLRRYRARWSVRRARDQATGALQDQQMSLLALDAHEQLGGTKTETLKAIGARLGLSFDQFRRSALLAQGEFAAFLRADGKDRSELLERVTGTEIYTRLGIAAHVKAAVAEQRLRDGRTGVEAIPVLVEDARVDAEYDFAVAQEARSAARVRLAEAEAMARWRAEADQRGRALAAAEADHGEALAVVAAAAADRSELALRRRAEQLRPAWDAAERLDRAVAIARRDVLAAEAAATRADRELAVAGERCALLAEIHAPIRAACQAIGLASIERPDQPQAHGRAPRVTQGPSDAVRGDAEGRGERPAWEELVARGREVRGDAEWLGARSELARVMSQYRELDARFAQHALITGAIASLDRALAGHTSRHAQLSATRALVVAEQQAAAGKLAELQRKAAALQQRRGLAGAAFETARRQEDAARTRLAEIDRLVSIAAGARQAVIARTEIDRQLAELDAAATADAEQRGVLATAHTVAEAVRAERAHAADELARAAGYTHARAELVCGEPCPLCGALEHPWRDRGALDDALAAARARSREADAGVAVAAAALLAIEARDHQRARERAKLAGHRVIADTSAIDAVGIWRDHLAALGELVLEPDPATPAAEQLAGDRRAAAKQALETARETRRQTEALAKVAADVQAEVQLQQNEVDQLGARLADNARALAEVAATAERLRGERAGRLDQLHELSAVLATAIASVAAIELRAIGNTAVARGTSGDRNASAWADLANGAGGDLQRARALLGDLAIEWRGRCERVGEVDRELTAATADLARDRGELERLVVELTVRRGTTIEQRERLFGELAAAAADLAVARVESGLDPDALRRLLFDDNATARIEMLADQLAGLDRVVERTRAIAAERAQLVAEHAALQPTASSDDTLDLHELAAQVTQADQLAARLEATLAADRDARARRAAAEVALAAIEEHANVDRVLGAVIGSHDGKRFRSFAQSLTLDGLLAVANAHLDELAPRYQLERVPRHDLELQVIDRDLGCEVRSIQSLSGGESFLVSLALALGLSSMAASSLDVRVRTLLIDEGFGTLDPATLDGALSVLDALQATGRQVGVISHVPALVERVGAHVRVIQRGGGRSEVVVASS